jgi:hypothetical protein
LIISKNLEPEEPEMQFDRMTISGTPELEGIYFYFIFYEDWLIWKPRRRQFFIKRWIRDIFICLEVVKVG